MSKPDDAFLCGYRPRSTPMVPISAWEGMSKAERKAVLNFQAYLRGKGQRCPRCLHKASKHFDGCTARDCECGFTAEFVLLARAEQKAPGFERD